MSSISLEQAIIDFPDSDKGMLKEFHCTQAEIDQQEIDREIGRKKREEMGMA